MMRIVYKILVKKLE